MPCKRPLFRISGFMAGVLLFIALLAAQLNSVLFNSVFQEKAVDRLDIYDRLMASAGPVSPNNANTFEAAVKSSITPDLFNKNVKSLIDGIIGYVSGLTGNLPDLYIAGSDKLSIAEAAGVTPAAVEKINLQLVMMFSNDQNYSDILSVISLIQFSLLYLPAFTLLLCAALIAAMLFRSPADLLTWLRATISYYFVICWFAASLLALMPFLFRLTGIADPVLTGVLLDYIRYCSFVVSSAILLSGVVVLAGMELALYLHRRPYKLSGTGGNLLYATETDNCRLYTPGKDSRSLCAYGAASIARVPRPYPNKLLPLLITIMIIYSLSAYLVANNAGSMFNKRNLGHAVSYIMGSIGYNRYIDARNEDVCLLKVKVLNEKDKMPVQELQTVIFPINTKGLEDTSENALAAPAKTDKNGTASFLLTEGDFRLILNTTGSPDPGSFGFSAPLTYDFSLSMPGRTDLTIILGSDDSVDSVDYVASVDSVARQPDVISTVDIPYSRIVGTSMQYMP